MPYDRNKYLIFKQGLLLPQESEQCVLGGDENMDLSNINSWEDVEIENDEGGLRTIR